MNSNTVITRSDIPYTGEPRLGRHCCTKMAVYRGMVTVGSGASYSDHVIYPLTSLHPSTITTTFIHIFPRLNKPSLSTLPRALPQFLLLERLFEAFANKYSVTKVVFVLFGFGVSLKFQTTSPFTEEKGEPAQRTRHLPHA